MMIATIIVKVDIVKLILIFAVVVLILLPLPPPLGILLLPVPVASFVLEHRRAGLAFPLDALGAFEDVIDAVRVSLAMDVGGRVGGRVEIVGAEKNEGGFFVLLLFFFFFGFGFGDVAVGSFVVFVVVVILFRTIIVLLPFLVIVSLPISCIAPPPLFVVIVIGISPPRLLLPMVVIVRFPRVIIAIHFFLPYPALTMILGFGILDLSPQLLLHLVSMTLFVIVFVVGGVGILHG
mmetsp:Transcript_31716/g.67154  ORF Transcript_31716/g.67154 Transcript_31716/m.67154 type:complete len:235 (+) Transcript_31716:300-1004(+)